MRTASVASFVVPGCLTLLACAPESQPAAPRLEAMSFSSSEWSEPVNLGAPINSAANEMNAALSPDELSLYFVSTRSGGLGGADIWVSRRASLDAPWGEPVNLGPNVNGPGLDAAPAVSLDGHLLFFSSDRPGGQGPSPSTDTCCSSRATVPVGKARTTSTSPVVPTRVTTWRGDRR